MGTEAAIALGLTILATAILYSSVGHAGASGYLAAMALFGIAPAVMKPTALTLNILVAFIATVKFYQAGCFSWKLCWPFAATSVPMAFVGGMLQLPGTYYKPIVGVVLLFAAYRLFQIATRTTNPADRRRLHIPVALVWGAAIGLLSGLTGVGGGIFLSPLLLLMNWAETRETAGVSAAFILVNSIAGLLGHLSTMPGLPGWIPLWAAAAVIGGWIGASYGAKRLQNSTLRRLLACVLVIAGLKLMLT